MPPKEFLEGMKPLAFDESAKSSGGQGRRHAPNPIILPVGRQAELSSREGSLYRVWAEADT